MSLQKPQQQRYDEFEEVLLPTIKHQEIATGYTKALTLHHLWDNINQIWRMGKSDARGNMLVKQAAQNGIIPKESTLVVPVFPGVTLPGNKDRVAVLIINPSFGTTTGSACNVRYNPSLATSLFVIPVAWQLYEDNWNGDINLSAASGGGVTLTVNIVEFF